MIRFIACLSFALLVLVFPTAAHAAAVSYTVAQLDALLVEGAVTDFTVANLIAGNNLDDMVGVGESLAGGNGFGFPNDITRRAAGSGADNRWIQTDNDEIWDLGAAYSTILVSNSFDHDRFLVPPNPVVTYLEALEYTAWGSNDQFAAFGGEGAPGIWELGKITAIYSLGWNPGETWDDFTAELNFDSGSAYRYVHVIAQNSIAIGGLTSDDNEINFVAGRQVPEPGALALLGLGLMGAGLLRRRSV